MYFNYSNEIEDPADSYIFLRRYKYTGEFDDLILMYGTYTGTGHHSEWSDTVSYPVINNSDYTYVLVWGGKTQQLLCGVNLAYTPTPIYFAALPLNKR